MVVHPRLLHARNLPPRATRHARGIVRDFAHENDVYPVGERVSCVALLPEEGVFDGRADTPESRRKLLRERFAGFGGETLRPVLDGLDGAERSDRTEVADLRIDPWHRGRVGLIGAAAAAVLPTVGVGASLAMESAAVLADELSRADARHLSDALRFYEKRRRDRGWAVSKKARALCSR